MYDTEGFGAEQLAEQMPVSRETLDRVEVILRTLDDWRTRMNLIGPAEWDRIWWRHIFDSLQLVPLLPPGPLVDLGSGAGFPGLIIAAARADGVTRSDRVTLVESTAKKCAFLRAAIEAADLPAVVCQERVERLTGVHADCVTARAFAPLPELLDYAAPWMEQGAAGVFLKGKRWEEELTAAQKAWKFACEVIPSRTSEDGVILKITEVSSVG